MAGARLATAGIISASNDVVLLGKGQYQLPDQTWHPAKMWLEGIRVVQVQAEGSKQKSILPADGIQTLVASTDTFRVMRNFADPKKPDQQVVACFVKQLYNQGGYLLTTYNLSTSSTSELNGGGLLLSYKGQIIAIPMKQEEFSQTMLTLFGDHPAIAKQLQAGELRPQQTKKIITAYVEWKRLTGN